VATWPNEGNVFLVEITYEVYIWMLKLDVATWPNEGNVFFS